MSHNKPGYFGTVLRATRTILDGMAVTFSYIFRPPITVQYPDRTPTPVVDALPERYRGLLEVDMDVCGACRACERDCPINCIRINLTKEKTETGKSRLVMTRFDIDMSKCMYCGICVESCTTTCRCDGDREETKAIHFTREFEGACEHPAQMVYRFIRPGDRVIAAKLSKEALPARRRGEIVREVRRRAMVYNALAFDWAREHGPPPEQKPAKGAKPAKPAKSTPAKPAAKAAAPAKPATEPTPAAAASQPAAAPPAAAPAPKPAPEPKPVTPTPAPPAAASPSAATMPAPEPAAAPAPAAPGTTAETSPAGEPPDDPPGEK